MSRSVALTAAAASALTVATMIAGVGSATATTPKPGEITVPNSSPPFIHYARVIGNVATTRRLSIQFWLKPNIAGAQRYADAASTPGTALFRHYLSPSAYTARFGPTPGQVGAVKSWLRGQGFSGVQADAQRDYVRATAPVATIDRALRVTLKLYRPSPEASGGPYTLYANDRPVTLPATVAADVLGITGLDNAAATRPLERLSTGAASNAAPCSHYFGQHQVSGLPKRFGTSTFYTYGCGYSAHQVRGAYGMNMMNTGKGQTVALVEVGLVRDMFLTLSDWAKASHLPAPSPARYEEIGLGRVSECGNYYFEEQLDVEAAYAMAPASHQLVMGADSCDTGDAGLQGLFDADIAVLNGSGGHPLASITSNSWGISKESAPGRMLAVAHAYFVRAAVEGVGMYFASGDAPGVEFPTDPYAISVGATALALGKNGQRLYETGWSSGLLTLQNHHWVRFRTGGGTSGGASHIFSQPAYQRGVVPRALSSVVGHKGPMRVTPDLSALGDPFNGMLTGLLSFPAHKPPHFFQESIAGTSLSSPLVAGMIADAQQGQPVAFGFTNPVLYSLYGTSAYHETLPLTAASPRLYRAEVCPPGPLCFGKITVLSVFDTQSPSMRGYTGQVTLKGFDTMTGIGTPNGQVFINALRLAEPPPSRP